MSDKCPNKKEDLKDANSLEKDNKEVEMAKKKSSSKRVKRSSVGVMKIRFKVSKKKKRK